MALTPEFINAVSANNLLRVRIMLKDSLLVDQQFNQFKDMQSYAEGEGVDFWMEKAEELEMLPKAEWNVNLMNLELTRLVNDFTKERLAYCKSIIKEVYGITLHSDQPHNQNEQTSLKQAGSNKEDYKNIQKSIKKMYKILKRNITPEGNCEWYYKDIESIQNEAKIIDRACENVKTRRDTHGIN